MPTNKYIGTKEVVRLTGLTTNGVYELIHSGALRAHKAPKSGWRVAMKDLEESGLMKEDIDDMVDEAPTEDTVMFIADEGHFSEVFKRMTEVRHSLKIATGDLKNFSVHVEKKGGEEKLRLCEFFLSLVERGVRLQVVCMKPYGFYLYAKEYCPQLLEHPLFELRYNKRCHMKMFIFDDDCAYIGSANITEAAIGKRANGKRNHEVGVLMWGENMLEEPLSQFDKAWDNPNNLRHTWKRFEKKAKEFEKRFPAE